MASKLDIARRGQATLRKAMQNERVMALPAAAGAGFLYGAAGRAGMQLPNVAGLGRHATCGLIAATIAMNTSGRIQQAFGALAQAGLALAGYELGKSGAVVAGDLGTPNFAPNLDAIEGE